MLAFDRVWSGGKDRVEFAPRAPIVAGWTGRDEAIMFCGTLGAIGGIRPAARFEVELDDPVLGRKFSHGYDIAALPVVS